MRVLSKELALVLAKYNELPSNVQKSIDYDNNSNIDMKGNLHLFKCKEEYLYVLPELFEKSLLTAIYGRRIDRTNDDSFDTLLCYYFSLMNNFRCIDETTLSIYVKGIENYTKNKGIEDTWHILNLAVQCLGDSYNTNFSALLTFYALVEILVLADVHHRGSGEYIHEECGRKLPQFLKKDDINYFPIRAFINNELLERKIFENLTTLRHKVIHGDFKKARDTLGVLFPVSDVGYGGNTEDSESSSFQDQLRNLNGLIRVVLINILTEWMCDPNKLLDIKKNIYYKGD